MITSLALRFRSALNHPWARLAAEWRRPLATAILLCFAILVLGPSDAIDRRLSDRLLRIQRLPADPAVLVVRVEPADVRRFEGPVLSRRGLAAALNRLADAGAQRVLVDLFQAEAMFEERDAALEAAIARFGPQRIALVTATGPDDKPYQRFARHAALVDARLTPDDDGWHRRIGRTDGPRGANPALWLATGQARSAVVDIDLRIDQTRFEARSVSALVDSKDRLDGRLVVISPGARVAPTRAAMPMMRQGDRALVLAMGVQSVRQNYAARVEAGHVVNLGLLLLGVLLGFACALAARSGRNLLLMSAASLVVLLAASIMVGRVWAIEVYPARLLACFTVMANVTLVQRLRIVPMMSSFLRGDISPEEVWAWRSWESAAQAALLIGPDGRIKRSNQGAAELVAAHGDRLAGFCIPRLGERASDLVLSDDAGTERHFALDWPFLHIQIVVLRDLGESEALARTLQSQLVTDELTGKANRRGFDHALNRAVGGPMAVFFLDMNGFKAVNDTYGHNAGDELLVITAQRLAEQLRPGDTVARLGGDEFAVVIARALDSQTAERLGRRMVEAISQPVLLGSVGREVRVGVAVGFALSVSDAEDPSTLLHRADKAMYRDKLLSKLNLKAA